MQKRKNKRQSISKKKTLKTQGPELYYIASNQNLLKDLTFSFYNLETRKKNKQIVMEEVGDLKKRKNSNTVENGQNSKGKNSHMNMIEIFDSELRKSRNTLKHVPELKQQKSLKEILSKLTSGTQSTLQSDVCRLRQQIQSSSPNIRKSSKAKRTHAKQKQDFNQKTRKQK